MNPRDFADDQTLYCTLAGMIYRQLQRCSDPALEKALNPLGLVLPFEARSAAVRNTWETLVKNALEGMGIIGSAPLVTCTSGRSQQPLSLKTMRR